MRRRVGAERLARRVPALLWALALSVGFAYLLLYVVEAPRLVGQLQWNASVASAYVMPPTLVKSGTGGTAVMGSVGDWVPLWFGLLSTSWPLHRELWGAMPTLLFVASALTVGWSVRQVADRRAAVLAALIGLVVSPLALAFLMSPFSHNVVYPCTALLGAYLIWLARGAGRSRVTAIVVPPALGVIVGTCVASDALLAATGVIPLAITALLTGLRRERRSNVVALSALTTAVVSVPVAKLTSTTMGSLGYVTLPTPAKLAPLSELPSRVHLLFDGLKALFNGYLGGPEGPGRLHAPLGLASDVVMCGALLAVIVVGARVSGRMILDGVRKRGSQQPAELARRLHIVYWTVSAAVACGAFWIAGEGPITTHYSYYFTVVFTVAAIVPLLLSTGALARAVIAAGACVYFIAGLVGLTSNYLSIYAELAPTASTVARIARATHAQYGYANWADAAGLTWGTHERVVARPVVECSGSEGPTLCPGFQTWIPAWYVPRRRRTFLLVEAGGVDFGYLPPNLGRPLAAYAFGSLHMYVYPYDIASRFGSGSG